MKYVSMLTKHKHHIIPKHAGGSDDSDNLVELTPEEHAEAHHKLYEDTGNELDYIAWKALTGQIGRKEARVAALRAVCKTEEHRNKLRKPKLTVEGMKGNRNGFKKGRTPHNKGRPTKEWLSEEARNSISKKMSGNTYASGKRSEEIKARMKLAAKNRKRPPSMSEETKAKISAGHKLRRGNK